VNLLREVKRTLATLEGSDILVEAAVQVFLRFSGLAKVLLQPSMGHSVRALQIVDHVHMAGKVPSE
jgi:hypothetical protein